MQVSQVHVQYCSSVTVRHKAMYLTPKVPKCLNTCKTCMVKYEVLRFSFLWFLFLITFFVLDLICQCRCGTSKSIMMAKLQQSLLLICHVTQSLSMSCVSHLMGRFCHLEGMVCTGLTSCLINVESP